MPWRPTWKARSSLFLAVLLLLAWGVAVFAQEANAQGTQPPKMELPKSYLCYRADVPPSLDGTMSSPVWDNAPWTDEFVDIEGELKPAPRFKTRVKMLWDDKYFYIGAKMEEPHVWGTLTERDSVIYHDNDFEVFIDPDGDNHQYYEFEMNALNTIWDLRLVKPYRDGGPALNEWDVLDIKTAVHVDGTLNDASDTDKGWSVEMAIPWRALGEFANRPAPPQDGDQWRVNFSRVEWDIDTTDGTYRKIPDRPEHNWVWSPQGVIDMHQPERWGYVQFSKAAPGTDTVRPDLSKEAREFLMRVYHAERDLKDKTGQWAPDFKSLGINPADALIRPSLEIKNADDFEAIAGYSDANGETRYMHVRADSLLWETHIEGY